MRFKRAERTWAWDKWVDWAADQSASQAAHQRALHAEAGPSFRVRVSSHGHELAHFLGHGLVKYSQDVGVCWRLEIQVPYSPLQMKSTGPPLDVIWCSKCLDVEEKWIHRAAYGLANKSEYYVCDMGLF